MRIGGGVHLCYCTNVHAGEQLAQVRDNLVRHVAAVKAEVCPDKPFGVGLWLSAAAARSLQQRGRHGQRSELAQLQALLAEHGLYVFTLNGFPYGAFHGHAIKQRVYEPDWRDPRRLAYSDALAELLAELLPEGVDGSVSTLPCGFGPAIRTHADEQAIADNLLQHVARLHALHERTGKQIALALEPEPGCHLETVDQAIAFFERCLRSPRAQRKLRDLGGAAAPELLQRHLGLCVDTCHAAVEHEQPREMIAKLRAAAIPIAKLQLSSGLRIEGMDAAMVAALQPYLDPIYLHQVVQSRDGVLDRYLDLPDALAALQQRATAAPPEWRVHFHVPVFLERLRHFGSTQAFLREVLALHKAEPLTAHLEVETYTWDVLPDEARGLSLTAALARELRFCMQELGVTPETQP
jgi:sugar phosphate isomerase/epimerase